MKPRCPVRPARLGQGRDSSGTDVPYIRASTGCRGCPPGRAGPDVLDQPRAVRPMAGGWRPSPRRAGHVVEQSRSRRSRSGCRRGRSSARPSGSPRCAARSRPAGAARSIACRDGSNPSNLEAGKAAAIVHRATPDRTRRLPPGPGVQAIDHAVQGGQDQRHQGEPGPRFGHALDAWPPPAEVVVAQPDPRSRPASTTPAGRPRSAGANHSFRLSAKTVAPRAQLEGLAVLGHRARLAASHPAATLLQPVAERAVGPPHGPTPASPVNHQRTTSPALPHTRRRKPAGRARSARPTMHRTWGSARGRRCRVGVRAKLVGSHTVMKAW